MIQRDIERMSDVLDLHEQESQTALQALSRSARWCARRQGAVVVGNDLDILLNVDSFITVSRLAFGVVVL